MTRGDFCLLVFVLIYFGYYYIKFRVKSTTEIKARLKNDIDFLHKNISFNNWKQGLASILGDYHCSFFNVMVNSFNFKKTSIVFEKDCKL